MTEKMNPEDAQLIARLGVCALDAEKGTNPYDKRYRALQCLRLRWADEVAAEPFRLLRKCVVHEHQTYIRELAREKESASTGQQQNQQGEQKQAGLTLAGLFSTRARKAIGELVGVEWALSELEVSKLGPGEEMQLLDRYRRCQEEMDHAFSSVKRNSVPLLQRIRSQYSERYAAVRRYRSKVATFAHENRGRLAVSSPTAESQVVLDAFRETLEKASEPILGPRRRFPVQNPNDPLELLQKYHISTCMAGLGIYESPRLCEQVMIGM
eukprot:CAMPEP_0174243672 /NCGR_PEP_ID=MMETSP0417-20130205/32474_1 /TAXON_ID=242541 /ORGANISM="Mayorella sp, Strain BSH-02190019" /LENGTH=267 /DNA_ID=CAMNT_0015323237 /DNA_START=70 /DNA_END=870 /DNA_ORIENTATION=+